MSGQLMCSFQLVGGTVHAHCMLLYPFFQLIEDNKVWCVGCSTIQLCCLAVVSCFNVVQNRNQHLCDEFYEKCPPRWEQQL